MSEYAVAQVGPSAATPGEAHWFLLRFNRTPPVARFGLLCVLFLRSVSEFHEHDVGSRPPQHGGSHHGDHLDRRVAHGLRRGRGQSCAGLRRDAHVGEPDTRANDRPLACCARGMMAGTIHRLTLLAGRPNQRQASGDPLVLGRPPQVPGRPRKPERRSGAQEAWGHIRGVCRRGGARAADCVELVVRVWSRGPRVRSASVRTAELECRLRPSICAWRHDDLIRIPPKRDRNETLSPQGSVAVAQTCLRCA